MMAVAIATVMAMAFPVVTLLVDALPSREPVPTLLESAMCLQIIDRSVPFSSCPVEPRRAARGRTASRKRRRDGHGGEACANDGVWGPEWDDNPAARSHHLSI
jgi:hypothetical protein